jgi:hypothetical protein
LLSGEPDIPDWSAFTTLQIRLENGNRFNLRLFDGVTSFQFRTAGSKDVLMHEQSVLGGIPFS